MISLQELYLSAQTLQNLQVVVLVFDLLVLSGLSVYAAIFYYKKQKINFSWPGLAVLFLLALALRLFVSPHTLIHENAHGYEYLRSAFSLDGYFFHGSGYYTFFWLVSSVFGRHPEGWIHGTICAFQSA